MTLNIILKRLFTVLCKTQLVCAFVRHVSFNVIIGVSNVLN